MMRRRFVMTVWLAAAVVLPGESTWGQDFHLVEPSGVITAEVYLQRGVMTVNDANGAQYVFTRDRSFDSIDRRYLGYWLPSLNRVVRFPRSGRGRMQVADLDDVSPRWTVSRRSVRPVRGRPGWGDHTVLPGYAFIPPRFQRPYGFPTFGYGYHSFGSGLMLAPGYPGWGAPGFFPPPIQSVVLDSNIIPRDPLPPVQLDLLNTAAREVRVTVQDRVEPGQSKQLRIPPGQSQPLLVKRDAGADHVRRVLTYGPDGSQFVREIVTPIPPLPRYELIVHEWRLQSVAIDRTGKSPNVIEDTNYQGRGLGRFELPPGDGVTEGRLDVVRAALAAGNAGAVAPMLDPEDTPGPLRPLSPLERMLQQQRRASER
jgi:hypothetical protein